MMEIQVTFRGETETLSAKEAGRLIKMAKAMGFKLNPDYSHKSYKMDKDTDYNLGRYAERYVVRRYMRLKDIFEYEAFSITMCTFDWFEDRH